MEESNEVPSDDNKMSTDKKVKRILKTPSQLKGLEDFYIEHKYPTEEQKLQLAEQLGLTEKQVSGWFCHRRLKDKRLAAKEEYRNGRQERSSGVIQDRGSGHRQDSCGSTEQGNHQHTDPREVESRRPHAPVFPAADLFNDRKSPHLPYATDMDSTSSDSSASLQERFAGERMDSHKVMNSKYLATNGIVTESRFSSATKIGYKPSGYLKVRGKSEHPEITAVKTRLGSHYCEEGPPLSVEFDSIPPGAFTTAVINSAHESGFAVDHGLRQSPDISGAKEEPVSGMKYGVYSAKMNSQDHYAEMTDSYAFENAYGKFNQSMQHSKKMSSHMNRFSSQKISPDTYKHHAREVSAHKSNGSDKINSRHGVERMVSDSFTGYHHDQYGGKSIVEQTDIWDHRVYRPGKSGRETVRANDLNPSQVRVKHRFTEPLDTTGGRPPKKMHILQNEEKPYGERKVKESHDQARGARQFRGKIHSQGHMLKSPPLERPANQFEGSTEEIPSGSSEDETADTSSPLG